LFESPAIDDDDDTHGVELEFVVKDLDRVDLAGAASRRRSHHAELEIGDVVVDVVVDDDVVVDNEAGGDDIVGDESVLESAGDDDDDDDDAAESRSAKARPSWMLPQSSNSSRPSSVLSCSVA